MVGSICAQLQSDPRNNFETTKPMSNAKSVLIVLGFLLALSSAFLAGRYSGLDYGTTVLLDSVSLTGPISVFLIFASFTVAYVRLMYFFFKNIEDGSAASGEVETSHGLKDSSSNHHNEELDEDFFNQIKSWRFRLRFSVSKIILLLLLTLIATFVLRHFLNPAGVLQLVFAWTVWLALFVIPIAKSKELNEAGLANIPFFPKLYSIAGSFLRRPMTLLSSRVLFASSALLLLFSFEFGRARLTTLATSDAACITTREGEVVGQLIGQTKQGLLIYLGRTDDSLVRRLTDRRSNFIPFNSITSIQSGCVEQQA